MTIGGTAKWAEEKLCEYLQDFSLIDKTKDSLPPRLENGDLFNSDKGIVVEVKATTKNEEKSDTYSVTLNQVRAMKYMVLVVVVNNCPKYGVDCVVYSPDYVIYRGLTHKGQHCPDGIAVQNWQPTKSDIEKFGCTFDEVNDMVIKAYARGEWNVVAKKIALERYELYEEFDRINKELAKEIEKTI